MQSPSPVFSLGSCVPTEQQPLRTFSAATQSSPDVQTPEDRALGQRIAAPDAGGHTMTAFAMRFSVAPSPSSFRDAKAQLESVLLHIAEANPQPTFAGRYLLLNDFVQGGQGIVAFARDGRNPVMQYAIKCAHR